MKFYTIGDIHGKNTWFDLVNDIDILEDNIKIIFIGDYVDSFDTSNGDMIVNLNEIISFKKEYPDKVVLLLGNHDIQYQLLHSNLINKIMCSGFRQKISESLFELFTNNKNIFQVAYQYDNYLWTHAGISDFAYKLFFQNKLPKNKLEWADELNRLYVIKDESLFHISRLRGGSSSVGSIFWADISETMRNPVTGLHQIVGHSHVSKVHTEVIESEQSEFNLGDPILKIDTSITFTDCLDTIKEMYILEI